MPLHEIPPGDAKSLIPLRWRRVPDDLMSNSGVHATTLQKDVAMCQRVQADQTELHLQQVAEKQAQTEELRQRNGELEGSLAELRGQHEQLLRDMADVRSRLKANRL